jgi:hypothetical protein
MRSRGRNGQGDAMARPRIEHLNARHDAKPVSGGRLYITKRDDAAERARWRDSNDEEREEWQRAICQRYRDKETTGVIKAMVRECFQKHVHAHFQKQLEQRLIAMGEITDKENDWQDKATAAAILAIKQVATAVKGRRRYPEHQTARRAF